MMEIKWITCSESTICDDCDFEDDALVDRQPVRFSKFILDFVPEVMNQRGRCTEEKRVAVD